MDILMSNREPRERKPRPRNPPSFVVEVRRDTYELLLRMGEYLNERGKVVVDLSDVIDELLAASPVLLNVISPKERGLV